MELAFWKMHGAGNDFILVDDRDGTFPADLELISRLCRAHTGIGSEGLILIQISNNADFRMSFFNPDGREVGMCGNGARCVARLAYDLGIAPASMQIETRAGIHRATIHQNSVTLELPPPQHYRPSASLALQDGRSIAYAFIDTGVPHVVVETDDISSYPVVQDGRAIRHHDAFAPEGTNVNFVQHMGTSNLLIRTYERGVENETLACGTGITAAAITVAKGHNLQPPINVVAASGDRLSVGFAAHEEAIDNVTLTGPAEYVFRGEMITTVMP